MNLALPQCGHGCWPPTRTNGFGGRWVAISSDICQSTPTKIQNTHVRVKMGFYISQYPIFRIAQSTLLTGRPIHLNTILTSLESIQQYCMKTIHTLISTTVYGQVLLIELSDMEHGFTGQHRVRTLVFLDEALML